MTDQEGQTWPESELIEQWWENHRHELKQAASKYRTEQDRKIEALLKENERLEHEINVQCSSEYVEKILKRQELLDKVIRAADLLADEVRCEERKGLLVSDAAVYYFVERQALAALKAPATPESSAPVQHTDPDKWTSDDHSERCSIGSLSATRKDPPADR